MPGERGALTSRVDTARAPRLTPPDHPLTDEIVVLRLWRASDVDAVVQAMRDPAVPRWTSVPSVPVRRERVPRLDRRASGAAGDRHGLHFAVVDRHDRLLAPLALNGPRRHRTLAIGASASSENAGTPRARAAGARPRAVARFRAHRQLCPPRKPSLAPGGRSGRLSPPT